MRYLGIVLDLRFLLGDIICTTAFALDLHCIFSLVVVHVSLVAGGGLLLRLELAATLIGSAIIGGSVSCTALLAGGLWSGGSRYSRVAASVPSRSRDTCEQLLAG